MFRDFFGGKNTNPLRVEHSHTPLYLSTPTPNFGPVWDFLDHINHYNSYARGGHSHIMELLMLVNQPQKWTLNGVIGKGWFATLNGVTLHISNPKWRNEPKSYPKWRIGQNLTLNGVLTNILYKRYNKTRHHNIDNITNIIITVIIANILASSSSPPSPSSSPTSSPLISPISSSSLISQSSSSTSTLSSPPTSSSSSPSSSYHRHDCKHHHHNLSSSQTPFSLNPIHKY